MQISLEGVADDSQLDIDATGDGDFAAVVDGSTPVPYSQPTSSPATHEVAINFAGPNQSTVTVTAEAGNSTRSASVSGKSPDVRIVTVDVWP